MAGMNLPQVRYELIRLQGGLDQVTPTLSLSSGVARRAANFEASITCTNGTGLLQWRREPSSRKDFDQ